jgi:AmiR/NasT family two-component response regulator
MDKHGMGEADAFSFIQKKAMDRRARMSEVAKEIVEGALTP